MIRCIIRHPSFKTHLSQGIKFIISGLGGATIELGSLTLLVEATHMPPPDAYLVAGLLSVTFVFLFNSTVTFRNAGGRNMRRQIVRFALVYSTAFAVNYILTMALYFLGMQYQLAKAVVIGLMAAINYSLSHSFIFKKEKEALTQANTFTAMT